MKATKNERIYLRVTPELKQSITDDAARADLSVSEYILSACQAFSQPAGNSKEIPADSILILNRIYNTILVFPGIGDTTKKSLLKELNNLAF